MGPGSIYHCHLHWSTEAAYSGILVHRKEHWRPGNSHWWARQNGMIHCGHCHCTEMGVGKPCCVEPIVKTFDVVGCKLSYSCLALPLRYERSQVYEDKWALPDSQKPFFINIILNFRSFLCICRVIFWFGFSSTISQCKSHSQLVNCGLLTLNSDQQARSNNLLSSKFYYIPIWHIGTWDFFPST